MKEALEALLRSRKFLLLLLDTVISLILFFVGRFAPSYEEMVNMLIGTLQPVFVAIIVAIAIEDGAEKLRNGQ